MSTVYYPCSLSCKPTPVTGERRKQGAWCGYSQATNSWGLEPSWGHLASSSGEEIKCWQLLIHTVFFGFHLSIGLQTEAPTESVETLPEITFLFNQGLAIVAQALNSPSPASYSSGPELTISVSCAEMTAMSHSQLPTPFLTNMQCLQGFQRLQSWNCKKSYSDRTNSVYTKTRQEPGSQFKHTASRVW